MDDWREGEGERDRGECGDREGERPGRGAERASAAASPTLPTTHTDNARPLPRNDPDCADADAATQRTNTAQPRTTAGGGEEEGREMRVGEVETGGGVKWRRWADAVEGLSWKRRRRW